MMKPLTRTFRPLHVASLAALPMFSVLTPLAHADLPTLENPSRGTEIGRAHV